MAKHQSDHSDDSQDFLTFAKRLAANGQLLQLVREDLNFTRKQFAKRAGISVKTLARYENAKPFIGNFKLYCLHIRNLHIDPRLIHDQGYLDGLMIPNLPYHRREGSIDDRDNWYEFGEPKYRHFRRWAHRKYIEKMSDKEREEQMPYETIVEWFEEWNNLFNPDANGGYRIRVTE